MSDSTRLDSALVERGLCGGRDRAKEIISGGSVSVNGTVCTKPSRAVSDGDTLEIKSGAIPFVSRGGLKLDKAVKEFSLCLDGLVCADIGASTGGFTDCMLQNGAKRVYAADTGSGQLAQALRLDKRVINLENLNFRNATERDIPESIDFAGIDVSFISVRLILPVLYRFLKDGGGCVCLIKPQFEAGREHIGKNGVVKSAAVHSETILSVMSCAAETGFSCEGLSFSPIKGPKGNIEYLLLLKKRLPAVTISKLRVDETVGLAHNSLR